MVQFLVDSLLHMWGTVASADISLVLSPATRRRYLLFVCNELCPNDLINFCQDIFSEFVQNDYAVVA